jgi:hypothetical protein
MKENFTKANRYPNRASPDNRGEECGKRGERLCGREQFESRKNVREERDAQQVFACRGTNG